MYPHFACSRAWNGMSSTVRWPMIWQVVVWNKRVLQDNGGVVIYVYIYIFIYTLYISCMLSLWTYIYNIYINIHTHIKSHVYVNIYYILYILSICCICISIHYVMWLSRNSPTLPQLDLRVSGLGFHGIVPRLCGLEMVYPKEVKRRVSTHQPTKHDNLKIPKMSDSTK